MGAAERSSFTTRCSICPMLKMVRPGLDGLGALRNGSSRERAKELCQFQYQGEADNREKAASGQKRNIDPIVKGGAWGKEKRLRSRLIPSDGPGGGRQHGAAHRGRSRPDSMIKGIGGEEGRAGGRQRGGDHAGGMSHRSSEPEGRIKARNGASGK